jgi:hypothetical protein
VPILLVHPCLEWARVRQPAFGEAVNADFEAYNSLGFHDPAALAHTWPLRPAGWASVAGTGADASLHVRAAGQSWSAPVPYPVARLALTCGGTLIGITFDREPGRLAADAAYLEYGLGNGDLLLGWAPLRGYPDKYRPPRLLP